MKVSDCIEERKIGSEEMNIEKKVMDYIIDNDLTPQFDYELAKVFDIEKDQMNEFRKVLDSLVLEGKLIKSTKNKYGLPKYFSLATGKLEIAKKGFGFVITNSKEETDIFIPRSNLNGAMHGDVVAVKLLKESSDGRKREGVIKDVINRGNSEIIGTFEKAKGFGFVVPDDKRINWDLFVPGAKTKNAKDNYKVIAQVDKWPEGDRNPEGKIIEILGESDDPFVEEEAIIKSTDVRQKFSDKVIQAAEALDDTISKSDIKRRVDYRELRTVTIDGADARDFDDAISIEEKENGFNLWVHIADVSHFVKEDDIIDKEAIKRATSIYLPDRVIPMLPERISNNLCSLKPKVDRMSFSVKMEIDETGEVTAYKINPSIINSNERMIYEDVTRILDGDSGEDLKKYDYIKDDFFVMSKLAKILNKKRFDRGAIDFDFPETKINIDDKGYITEIYKYERGESNRIIEEFMLLTNEVVAEHVYWMDLPFIYRVHEDPDEEKIKDFKKFIHNLGYNLKGSETELHPKQVQDLLEAVKGEKSEYIINKMMLRSLKQAKYSPVSEGHFGLAAEYYSHFTSPIRRYPDLQIHRILKLIIDSKMDKKMVGRMEKRVQEVSEISSEKERIAETLERDVTDLKKAEYMKNHIGDEFVGLISSVTSFGIFVQLENTVEGLIRMEDLKDDYYEYIPEHVKLVGERTKNEYKLGQEIKIKVDRVNIKNREIDFMPV
ncbi:MAG TPA: ribonuclease R [Clostridia bacterium]|nr:ribonuclease R [Clostridia bacterium]